MSPGKAGSVAPIDSPDVLLDVPLLLESSGGSRSPEKDIKFGGKIWRIIRNDADPLPSNPHAHLLGKGCKVHLGTGDLYRRSRVVDTISKKELNNIREAAEKAGIVLPPMT